MNPKSFSTDNQAVGPVHIPEFTPEALKRRNAAVEYRGACNSYADALAAFESAKLKLAMASENRERKFEALLDTLTT